ncbi:MAG: preprotein translocase subunit SecA, partial [Chloroflexi bacterium]|nr:preprotein translocase subunit SecA [Chloroflexota bacterium]
MFKLFGGGDSNEKIIKKYRSTVDKINNLEESFAALNDQTLKEKTDEFRSRLADGASLNDILPEAFAAVREATKRTLGLRQFDVQLIGGIVLHDGKIAEMKTGEGKTLTAVAPLYLNALAGKTHLVTVNDYLARRDPYWMGPVYTALGMTVASIYPQQNMVEFQPARIYDAEYDAGEEEITWKHFRPVKRKEAYQADVLYGTASEFGFDYLRDNMAINKEGTVQLALDYAIVDEIDSLLIDEARTPLIISAPDMEATKLYSTFAALSRRLSKNVHYTTDEKRRNAELTDDGWAYIENALSSEGILKENSSLYDPQNAHIMRHVKNAISAKEFYIRNHQYVIENDEIIIVDEFTGRKMIGRRYSEGLHQAIEAKENVKVQAESKTYATITIQNYFRMYKKLSGMTGTAETEAEEFEKIYKLEVVVIPTNKPTIREDYVDIVYKDTQSKFMAVAKEVKEYTAQGRPVLVGTISVENSEALSQLFTRLGIKHNVLNAKQHEREAGIIAEAGLPGAVTVATNMAGRGVDIILGGKEPAKEEDKEYNAWQKRHQQVLEAGGLYVIGTERHESRRIDNQLRGRSGRQGDAGGTQFFVSMEDDIMRRFGGDRVKSIMEWSGAGGEEGMDNSIFTKLVEQAQKRVEGYNFDIRKHLVEFDDVINTQRDVIYKERRKILDDVDLKKNYQEMISDDIEAVVYNFIGQGRSKDNDPDYEGMIKELGAIMPLTENITAESLEQYTLEDITDRMITYADELYRLKEE